MAVFVDTSVWYAIADASETTNAGARAAILALAPRGLVTSEFVLVEAYTLIEARLGHDAALRFWGGLRSGATLLLGLLARDLARAWAIENEWQDQRFGIVDATSFAVMERLGVREALSLDDHFRTYRFGPRRRSRFRVYPAA